MNPIRGWIQVILFSGSLLLMILFLYIALPGLDSESGRMNFTTTSGWFSFLGGYIVILILLVLGIRSGIKNIKRNKSSVPIPYDEKLYIKFHGQVDFKSYRNMMMEQFFKRPLYLVFVFILLPYLLFSQDNLLETLKSNPFILIIPFVFVATPLLTLMQVRKAYKTNKVFHSVLNYELNNECLHIKGETIDTTVKWSHFVKVKETKGFFMFYHGNNIATLLSKTMFYEGDITKFKNFIKSLNIIKE